MARSREPGNNRGCKPKCHACWKKVTWNAGRRCNTCLKYDRPIVKKPMAMNKNSGAFRPEYTPRVYSVSPREKTKDE